MKTKSVESLVKDGIHFLSRFFPKYSYLCFPLLSAVIVWAVERGKEWKEKIFAWKVWLEPAMVQTKPDEYVLSFFQNNPPLNKAFREDIKNGDMASLRRNFRILYPVIGLEDPFLQGLFHEELEAGEYRKITEHFEERVNQAVRDIEPLEQKAEWIEGLENIAKDAGSLGIELISRADLQKKLARVIKKELSDPDE